MRNVVKWLISGYLPALDFYLPRVFVSQKVSVHYRLFFTNIYKITNSPSWYKKNQTNRITNQIQYFSHEIGYIRT